METTAVITHHLEAEETPPGAGTSRLGRVLRAAEPVPLAPGIVVTSAMWSANSSQLVVREVMDCSGQLMADITERAEEEVLGHLEDGLRLVARMETALETMEVQVYLAP